MSKRICEFCENKSRFSDYPEGSIICGCENPKNIHDECLFKKFTETNQYFSPKPVIICETCDSKILLNGTFYTFYKVNGLCSSMRNYKDSILEGKYEEYEYNGESLKKQCTYKNGLLEGNYKEWVINKDYEHVLYLECNYSNGLLEGTYIEYDENDQSISEKLIYKSNEILQKFT
jgi:antitoxin component YwqK of YwqJK toxin-antitoxin module